MRIVVSGDKSRYHFFRSIKETNKSASQEHFFTEVLCRKDLYLTSDLKKVGEDIFYSTRIPLNTELYFPSDTSELSEVYQERDKVIRFDEFPYATDDEIEQLNYTISNSEANQVSVILFKSNRQGLDSDISTEEMALDDAEKRYRKRNISVFRYSEGELPMFLLWELNQDNAMIKNEYNFKLDSARLNLDIFDSYYELMFDNSQDTDISMSSIINFDVLNSFVVYGSDINAKNVWNVYYERSYQYYLSNEYLIKLFCKKMYKFAIEDICLWDFNKDFDNFYIRIKNQYKEEFDDFIPKIFYGDKTEYDEFLNIEQEKIVDFKMRIQNFFTDRIKKMMKARIEKSIERMEMCIR